MLESTPKSNIHGYLNCYSQTISTAKNAKNYAKCAKCSLLIYSIMSTMLVTILFCGLCAYFALFAVRKSFRSRLMLGFNLILACGQYSNQLKPSS
jgi:hypothetical protein